MKSAKKVPVNIMLRPSAVKIVDLLAEQYGLSRSAMIENLIRAEAAKLPENRGS